MSFEELWLKVKALKVLPDTAIAQVPFILSDETKRSLMQITPQEVAEIVTAAIEDVNKGSVSPLDELIRKRL